MNNLEKFKDGIPFLIAFLVLCIFAFNLFAFSVGDLNFTNWSEDTRGGLAGIWGFILFATGLTYILRHTE